MFNRRFRQKLKGLAYARFLKPGSRHASQISKMCEASRLYFGGERKYYSALTIGAAEIIPASVMLKPVEHFAKSPLTLSLSPRGERTLELTLRLI